MLYDRLIFAYMVQLLFGIIKLLKLCLRNRCSKNNHDFHTSQNYSVRDCLSIQAYTHIRNTSTKNPKCTWSRPTKRPREKRKHTRQPRFPQTPYLYTQPHEKQSSPMPKSNHPFCTKPIQKTYPTNHPRSHSFFP